MPRRHIEQSSLNGSVAAWDVAARGGGLDSLSAADFTIWRNAGRIIAQAVTARKAKGQPYENFLEAAIFLRSEILLPLRKNPRRVNEFGPISAWLLAGAWLECMLYGAVTARVFFCAAFIGTLTVAPDGETWRKKS